MNDTARGSEDENGRQVSKGKGQEQEARRRGESQEEVRLGQQGASTSEALTGERMSRS